MPPPGHSRLESVAPATRLVVALLLLLDFVDSLIRYWGADKAISIMAQSSLALMATLAVLWDRPRWSAALGLAVMTSATFIVGPSGLEPWYVCCAVVVTIVRGRQALPVAHALLLAWYPLLLELNGRRIGAQYEWSGLTAGLVLIAVSATVGVAIRVRMARHRVQRTQLRQARERAATARADERARLARELQRLVERQLDSTLTRVRAADRRDVRQLRAALDAVDDDARTSLTRLRELLDALRAPDPAEADSAPGRLRTRHHKRWLGRYRVQIVLLLTLAFVLLRQVWMDGSSVNPLTLFAGFALGFALVSYRVRAPRIWLIAVLPLVGLAANLRFDSGPLWFGCVGALLGTLGGWAWRHFDDTRANTARRIAASDSERLTVVHEERSALARELHDVVARQLSLITLRVMAVWDCQDTDTLAAACNDIEDATHTARHELRTLVAGMQGGPEESDPGTHVVPPTITMECLANDLLAHGFTVRHR
ncbi:MAG: histidine kinase, partial [Actinomycetales bacterium]